MVKGETKVLPWQQTLVSPLSNANPALLCQTAVISNFIAGSGSSDVGGGTNNVDVIPEHTLPTHGYLGNKSDGEIFFHKTSFFVYFSPYLRENVEKKAPLLILRNVISY